MLKTKFEDPAIPGFFSYADNRRTHTHIRRPSAKNVIFGFRGPQKG